MDSTLPAANFDMQALTFDWLNHVIRDGEGPALLRDRVNFHIMGANEWRHAPSLNEIAEDIWRLHITAQPAGEYFRLSATAPNKRAAVTQIVNLADRTTNLNDYYPDPIKGWELESLTGRIFVSEPLETAIELSGMFFGRLDLTINKRDVDLGVVLYELLEDGTLFQLSHWLGRASYSEDRSNRRLLAPGESATIHIKNSYTVSRRVRSGSQIVVIVDVNKILGIR